MRNPKRMQWDNVNKRLDVVALHERCANHFKGAKKRPRGERGLLSVNCDPDQSQTQMYSS
jgi:hypothetical protein